MTLIEPGGFSTDWGGASATHSTELDAYKEVREARQKQRGSMPIGDPVATRTAIMKVVDAEKPPLRIFFGKMPLTIATADYESRLATWNEWQDVSVEAHG
ncbi:hypothetical protein BH09ACT10_BH09ACT10_30790 [soil metagenome]